MNSRQSSSAAHADGFGPGREFALIWVLAGRRATLPHVVFRHSTRRVIFSESGAAISRGTGVSVQITGR